MSADFFHMTIGAGIAVSTMTVAVLLLFRMMLELIGDLIESSLEAKDK
jgi:hypothetical protein